MFLLFALFLAFSLFSYDPNDVAYFTTRVNNPAKNYAGVFGAWIAFALTLSFGIAAYLLPLISGMISIAAFTSKDAPHFGKKSAMGIAFVALSALLFSIGSWTCFAGWDKSLNIPNPGGIVGQRIACDILARYIGSKGALLLLVPLWIMSGILFFNIPWANIFHNSREFFLGLRWIVLPRTRRIASGAARLYKPDKNADAEKAVLWRKNLPPVLHTGTLANSAVKKTLPTFFRSSAKPKENTAVKPSATGAQKIQPLPAKPGTFHLPTLELLETPREVKEDDVKEDLQLNAKILEATLRDFGIEAEVVEVHRGPVITRYELQPAPGVKVNRITVLSDDIALAMKAASIRIVAPIPGKAAVGIEVPNAKSMMVSLKELLVSEEFETSKARIPLALGKDVSGKPIVADLADMPHLLIAGSTGSGKTVCVNSIILSILYTLTPEQCKLLLVDPKMVELSNYRNIPHLLGPVVTDPKKVSAALYYAVREMEKRYKILAEVGVRNIEGFNNRPNKEESRNMRPAQDAHTKVGPDGQPESEEPEPIPSTLPYIVIVIDELADLMMVAPQDIETAITRLAQLSRAVGIHLILATQRPSVDVITGVIKANFPARISFQVASKVDSRTILDANGADKLLGKGDLLYLPPGTSKLVRAQGTWVSDPEIHRVIQYIKAQGSPVYSPEIFEALKREGPGNISLDEEDELYDEAVEAVLHSQQASASLLQRRLRVGYARAARLIDTMEERGVVGASRGSKARDILVKMPGMDEAPDGR